ncbi:MAG: GntR family transcriptional regulator [Acidimicrobiales bacterium]|jgi:GntR family transcriptional regulator
MAELKVVRRNRVTLTQSCAEALEEAIELGMYSVGGRLPSEADLAELLAVSRPTLRESLRLLEERGIIRRQHGRGSFVCERPSQGALNRNFGVTSMIRASGRDASTKQGRVVSVQADDEVAQRLGLKSGDALWQLERLRLADGQPVVFSLDTVAAYTLEREDLDDMASGQEQSLYTLLYSRRGITIQRGYAELVPFRASSELTGLLGVKTGTAILCVKQVDFDQHGAAIVYSVDYHVPEWARFRVERAGPGTSSAGT